MTAPAKSKPRIVWLVEWSNRDGYGNWWPTRHWYRSRSEARDAMTKWQTEDEEVIWRVRAYVRRET